MPWPACCLQVGDYLIEVPTDLASRVPKDWQKASGLSHRGGSSCMHGVAVELRSRRHPAGAAKQPSAVRGRPAPLQVNSVKKGVRFRPPEVAPGLQRLDLARERLEVRAPLARCPCTAAKAHGPSC